MSQGKDKIHIRLRVYDSELPVRINREDEEMYRAAATLITDTINAYQNRASAGTSQKTVLYMALIDIAMRYGNELKRNDTQQYLEVINTITNEVEKALDGQ